MTTINRKYLVSIVLTLLVWVSINVAHGGFSERLYCQSRGDAVRVYLFEEEETYKCDAYLAVLNINLKQEYSSLLQIMNNLSRGDDRQYRQELYDAKKEVFLRLFSQIKQIETAVQDFQTSLLKKCQEFIFSSVEKEKSDLEAQLSPLQNQDVVMMTFAQQTQLQKLQSHLANLQILQQTEDIDAFVSALEKYFTFKYGNLWK